MARIAESIRPELNFTWNRSVLSFQIKRIHKRSGFYLKLLLALLLIALSNIPAHASNNDSSQAFQVHTVKAGDSLSKIAYEYYGDYTKTTLIAKFNNIDDIDRLKIGQKIKIPVLSLEQTQKGSEMNVEDLNVSKRGENERFEEKSLNKGRIDSRLDLGTVIFIIIYLLIVLSLVLIRWLGMQDVYHTRGPADDVSLFDGRKWKMK